MTVSLPACVAASPDTLFREVGGEAVLLNLESERYYILDDVGMRMWQLLIEHGDVGTAMGYLLAEYDVDDATLRHDLARLIAELGEAGLITVQT